MRLSHKGLLLLGGICLALVPISVAAELLPATLAGWQRMGSRRVEAGQFEQFDPRDAAVWREYGGLVAERAVYRQAAQRFTLMLLEMRDSSGAYGALSFFGAGGQPVQLGEAGRRTATGVMFYQGKYFVSANPVPSPDALAALQALASTLAERSPGLAPLPSLPSFLPRQGLQPGSDCYLLGPVALARLAPLAVGDWLGFAYGTEAEWAEYELGGKPARFLLASYPTPQLAAERVNAFAALFNLNGTGDPARPLVYAKRVGPLVALVLGIDSGSLAAGLLSQVRYEYELTWSETGKETEAADWARILINIFIATGLLLVYALAAGLLFAGVRLAVKRLWPGKVFDRPEDIEIIRLDLSRR